MTVHSKKSTTKHTKEITDNIITIPTDALADNDTSNNTNKTQQNAIIAINNATNKLEISSIANDYDSTNIIKTKTRSYYQAFKLYLHRVLNTIYQYRYYISPVLLSIVMYLLKDKIHINNKLLQSIKDNMKNYVNNYIKNNVKNNVINSKKKNKISNTEKSLHSLTIEKTTEQSNLNKSSNKSNNKTTLKQKSLSVLYDIIKSISKNPNETAMTIIKKFTSSEQLKKLHDFIVRKYIVVILCVALSFLLFDNINKRIQLKNALQEQKLLNEKLEKQTEKNINILNNLKNSIKKLQKAKSELKNLENNSNNNQDEENQHNEKLIELQNENEQLNNKIKQIEEELNNQNSAIIWKSTNKINNLENQLMLIEDSKNNNEEQIKKQKEEIKRKKRTALNTVKLYVNRKKIQKKENEINQLQKIIQQNKKEFEHQLNINTNFYNTEIERLKGIINNLQQQIDSNNINDANNVNNLLETQLVNVTQQKNQLIKVEEVNKKINDKINNKIEKIDTDDLVNIFLNDFEKMENELKEINQSSLSNMSSSLMIENNNDLNLKNIELQANLMTLQEENKKYKKEIEQKNIEIANLNETMKYMTISTNKLKSDLQKLKEENYYNSNQKDIFSKENQNNHDIIINLENKIKSNNNKINELESVLEQKIKEYNFIKKEHDGQISIIKNLRIKESEYKKAIPEIKSKNQKAMNMMENTIAKLNTEKNNLINQLQSMQDSIKDSKNYKLKEFHNRINNLIKNNSHQENKLNEANKIITKHEQSINNTSNTFVEFITALNKYMIDSLNIPDDNKNETDTIIEKLNANTVSDKEVAEYLANKIKVITNNTINNNTHKIDSTTNNNNFRSNKKRKYDDDNQYDDNGNKL